MIVPNLAQEVAYWKDRLRPADPAYGDGVSKWTITASYVDNLSHAELGDVWGLCYPDASTQSAKIFVRTPRTAADIAEVHETIVHEVLHCLFACMDSPMAEEEQAVWTLSPLLVELRSKAPERAKYLARALARPQTPTQLGAFRVRARTGDRMDKKALLALLALIGVASTPEDRDKMLKELTAQIEAMPDSDPASVPAPKVDPEAGKAPLDETKPPLGMQEPGSQEKEAMRAAARKEAAGALARVLPGLTDEQRAFAARLVTVEDVEAFAKASKPGEAPPEGGKPRMGHEVHPGKGAGGETTRARMLRPPEDPEVRARLGVPELGIVTGGMRGDVPGHIIVMDYAVRSQERLRATKGGEQT